MTDLFAYLGERLYPGRGIMLGMTPSGRSAVAYFIMGRSENSRNRVFEKTPDGIRTKAYDESRMTDPSLIIYHPVRRVGRGLVVTNGDQTDTLRDNMAIGRTFAASLHVRAGRAELDPAHLRPAQPGQELQALDTEGRHAGGRALPALFLRV